MPGILLIDDNEAYCEQIKKTLALKDFSLHYEIDPEKGLESALENNWDVVLLDIVLNGKLDGLEILRRLKTKKQDLPVIMISGTSTLDSAMQAIQEGAYDYLEKPIDIERLMICIQHAIEYKKLIFLNHHLHEEFTKRIATIGISETIRKALERLSTFTDTMERILITGERGTGKELMARMLHFGSKRKYGPFISFHCDIQAEDNETLLFGTDCNSQEPASRKGLICQADTGTLFLGEISKLSVNGQKKLLKFIHKNFYMPPKFDDQRPVDIRIIASTSVDLAALSKEGKFSEELLDLLSTFTFHMPPLRERLDDIPGLVDHFLKMASAQFNVPKPDISEKALNLLKEQKWEKNMTQLKSVVIHILLLSKSRTIDENIVKAALTVYRLMHDLLANKPFTELEKDLKALYLYYSKSHSTVSDDNFFSDSPVSSTMMNGKHP
ncbi:MAG: sigma-54-dependent Fis family transcriptional regulator [Calditrichaeota bacterium]|nr:sigma-54-dependent Fis family transcriptional regulator [Calditrichota bacterium]